MLEASALTEVYPLTEEELGTSSVQCRGIHLTSLNRRLSARTLQTNHKTDPMPGFRRFITFLKRSPSCLAHDNTDEPPHAWTEKRHSPRLCSPSRGACVCGEDLLRKAVCVLLTHAQLWGTATCRWQQLAADDRSTRRLYQMAARVTEAFHKEARVRQLSNVKALRHKLIIQPPEDNC